MFVTYGDEAAVDATSATEDAYAAYQQYYQQQYAQQQVAPQPVHHGKPNPFAVLKNKQDLRSDLTAIMGEDAGVSLNFFLSMCESIFFEILYKNSISALPNGYRFKDTGKNDKLKRMKSYEVLGNLI